MLIVEELFLLLTKDDGRPEGSFTPAYGYAAAAVVDLVLAERVTLSDDVDPRVRLVSAAPTDHPVLDAALARLAQKDGKKLSSLLQDGTFAPAAKITASLSRAGVVRVEEKRMLGLVPERAPVVDPGPERHLRSRLRVALNGREVTPHESTLLAILSGLDVAHKVLADEADGLSEKQLKNRIAEVAADAQLAGTVDAAVKRAVDAVNAAIMAAVIIPAATAGSD